MAEKFIIGVDGSDEGRAALRWGLQRASAHDATVELLNIADDSFLAQTPVFVAEAQEVAEQILATELEFARACGFDGEITGTAVVGHPVGELERASKRADLLILGAHHGSKLAGTFFGTRAVKVAAAAHCPVAVVPLKDRQVEKKIVVGVDGSAASKAAVKQAAAEASALGYELVAVYGWMPPLTPGLEHLWSPELIQEQEDQANEAIAVATAGLLEKHPDLVVKREIIKAPPIAALIEAGKNAATMVVGSRGRGAISRLLLGSVSHGVLQALPCPVIITRA